MCKPENEDSTHFTLWCPDYSETRNKCVKLEKPYMENEGKITGDFYI